MNALHVQNLSAAYRDTPVLEAIDWTVPTGRLVGIIGPNGAGKSTLIKAMLGLIDAEGDVRFFGQPLSEVKHRVVYVPQRGSVDWDFPVTVLDVVRMGRYGKSGWFSRLRGEDKRIADAALEQMGIGAFRDRQISELSGGQQQRVFLARALAQEGDLLLMDEPFVGVDATTERAIIDLLQAMRDEGKTAIVVNHDLQTARHYFDDILLLNKSVVAFGAAEDVFTPELLSRTYGGRLAVIPGSEGDVLVAG